MLISSTKWKFGWKGRGYREGASLPLLEGEDMINLIDDLKAFIESEKQKENRTLSDWTKQWILESIIDGKSKITRCATNHSEKKMYVEFTFYQEDQNG